MYIYYRNIFFSIRPLSRPSLWKLLLVMVTDSVSGGLLGLVTVSMAYAADVSARDGASRTLHIAMVEVSISVGLGIGQLAGGQVYRVGGAVACFLVYMLCSLLNVLYIATRVRETRSVPAGVGVGERLRALVGVDAPRRTWSMLTRRRKRRRQLTVWLAALVCYELFSCMLQHGEYSSSMIFIFILFTLSALILFLYDLLQSEVSYVMLQLTNDRPNQYNRFYKTGWIFWPSMRSRDRKLVETVVFMTYKRRMIFAQFLLLSPRARPG